MALLLTFVVPPGTDVASLQSDPNIQRLTKTVESTVEDGYIKIGTVEGDKTQLRIYLEYKKDDVSPTLMRKEYTFAPSVEEGSENFIKQGYLYLKSLPEFSGALDC